MYGYLKSLLRKLVFLKVDPLKDKSFKKDILEKFKDIYFFEFQRKDQINTGINFLVVLYTIYGSSIVYLLNSLPKFRCDLIIIPFYVFLLFSVIFLFTSIYYFSQYFSSREYQYISYPPKIMKYLEEINEHNTDVHSNSDRIDLEDEFYELLIKQFGESAEYNSKVTQNKTKEYRQTVKWLFMSLIFIVFTSIPFYINKYQSFDDNKKAIIKNEEEKKNDKTTKTKTTKTNSPKTTKTKTATN